MGTVVDLVRWDVPFAGARDPSVSLITELGGDAAKVVVAPSGVDQYPKYLVCFERVFVSLCYEESVGLDRGFHSLTGIQRSVCAYLWTDSPWLVASRGIAALHGIFVQHYVIFGGDSIVELIASGQPKVERLDSHRVIETKYEV